MANPQNLQPPFVKGDKRINRKGRPKSFDALRKLAQEIAAEPISAEEKMTRIEALLRVMSSSRNPADRKTFLEYAFGKPKDEIQVEGGQEPVKVIVEYSKGTATPATSGAGADKAGTE